VKLETIGSLLLEAGKITPAGAERILRLQKESGMLFGEAAKSLGLVTDREIQQALAKQFDFPFLNNNKTGLSFELLAAYRPFSKQVEILRAVRSQLMSRWFDDNHKALAIVSPNNGEGRSFLAANLAVVFSQLGEKTLLIDGDLRQPRQHKLFNLEGKVGLSNLLAARVESAVAINQIAGFRDLSLLAAGTIPPNPQELIGKKLVTCLEELSHSYDVILIDTPASLQGSDAQLLAAKATGALLLGKQNSTRLAQLESLKEQLENTGTILVGSIINDF
jgi:protein-tyrosine kinase